MLTKSGLESQMTFGQMETAMELYLKRKTVHKNRQDRLEIKFFRIFIDNNLHIIKMMLD